MFIINLNTKNSKIKNQHKLNFLLFKKILNQLNTIYLYNLYFFDTSSFLDYLDYTNNFNFNTKNLLNNIQNFIPLNLYADDDIYTLFNNGLNSLDINKISKIKIQLQEKSKADLITFIYKLNTKQDINNLFKLININ